MEDFNNLTGVDDDGDGDESVESSELHNSSVFTQLKLYCLELLELLQNPKKENFSAIASLLQLLQSSPSAVLQPFFDYTLFPLLLLLDAAVDSRAQAKRNEASAINVSNLPRKVSDKVAEYVLQCLEELLYKCHLGSVDQMVVLMKKLTHAALLSPSEASEEFREGVIKCFKSLLLRFLPCSDETCSCKQSLALPALLESHDIQDLGNRPPKYDLEQGECSLAFLQSQAAAAAVGHWLSLLLKAADTEAARGHRGSGKLRVEAFLTLRVLVSKVGTADALAFFLPGVVSQFAKVLHVSKSMTSGAAGSGEATNQAIRGLAEYLMIVLGDDANFSSIDVSPNVMAGFSSNKDESVHSLMDELRHLPNSSLSQREMVAEESIVEPENVVTNAHNKLGKEIGPLHVDRTRGWIEKTSAHLSKLLVATFPHICIHPAKKVRQGLLAAIQGLLSKCSYTLKDSRLLLLECLCVLIVDDFEDLSAQAREFFEYLLSSSGKHHVQQDMAEIFGRLIEKLPKVILSNEESLALSHAQQLLVVVYFSGPQFLLDQLLSPVTAARFLDVFALCLGPNSVFAGALNKLTLARPSSVGYLPSIAELKASSLSANCHQAVMDAASSGISEFYDIQGIRIRSSETLESKYEIPRMPPWFVYAGSRKLYQALAGILRLVGLSLMADFRSEGHISVVTDIPLDYLRKLISEVRVKEYNNESWQSWYNRTGSGQLLRQASTAACILNEMMFGLSYQSVDSLTNMFEKSVFKREEIQEFDARGASGHFTFESPELTQSIWKLSLLKASRSSLIDCIGRILHEYLSSEVWDLPVDHRPSRIQPDGEVEELALHFFHDTAMLHQVIIDGIGTFALCLGKDFASSGFLHSSLYLLLEGLISSNFHVRSASDAVLHVLSASSGYATVGQLVLANADYIVDSICRQLRHLDLNPHVPNVLASMLSYIGVAHKIMPLLEEPMRSASQELEILGRHQHPELTIPFMKAVAEITKASKREASLLPASAESYLAHVKARVDKEKSSQDAPSHSGSDTIMSQVDLEQWESVLFQLNDSRRFRRTVGSIACSCLTAAAPLLASTKQAACLIALDIVEDGITTLAKVEEAYRHENQTKEAIEDMIRSYSLYHLQDASEAADEGTDENRLLPAMNKIWPFLVACIRNKIPVAVRRCLSVITTVVQICGGDFFSRRFHTDGAHFWKLLSTSPFQKKPFSKEQRIPLQLPYRSAPISPDDSMAEVSSLKVQVAVLNMIADLSRNKQSSSSLEAVLKKVSGLVVAIACSGVSGLHDASVNALRGLACIDPDLIWLLLADIYYSLKKKDQPAPPASCFPLMSQILPPPLSPKGYLYIQYGGQRYSFDVDTSSVEVVFKKLHSQVFSSQMYIQNVPT